MRGNKTIITLALCVGLSGLGCAADPAPASQRNGNTGNAAGTGAGSGTAGMSGASAAGSAGSSIVVAGNGSSGTGSTAGTSAGTGTSQAGASAAGTGSGASGMGSAAGMGASENVDCAALEPPMNYEDMIADFEAGTGATQVVDGRGGGFFMYNDGTGTQMPPTGALPPAEKLNRCTSLYALCMSGTGFTMWGAGMGTDLGPTVEMMKMPFDASAFKGIAFWARIETGTTPVLRVSLKDGNTAPEGGKCDESVESGETACNDDWGKTINVTSEWKPYTVLFDEMRQSGWGATYSEFDATTVYGIQWQFGPNLDFDLCIDDVQLVR